MVAISSVRASNALISSTFPSGLVAIFVGGTSGIGLTTLQAFVRSTKGLSPRIYFIGRSQSAADLIIEQCAELNPSASVEFVKADMSLIHVVDEACEKIKKKEKAINVLFISAGEPRLDRALTSEGLPKLTVLVFYSRLRVISNLLPLLRNASSLRRVVVVGGGGYEGPIYANDLPGFNIPLIGLRGHFCSLNTLGLEAIAKDAPTVSFVSDFPGTVDTPFSKHVIGILGVILRAYIWLFGWLICVPLLECGERHLWLATSARFPAAKVGEGEGESEGVVLNAGAEMVEVARGSNGKGGSGVYSVGWDGESASPKVWKLLARMREDGMVERVWEHVQSECRRITDGSDIEDRRKSKD